MNLRVNEVSPYLPYRVKVKEKEEGFIQILFSVDLNGCISYVNWNAPENHKVKDILLILRPIESLHEPITHPDFNNGNEFIPLIELAKSRLSDCEYNHSLFYQDGIWFVKSEEMGSLRSSVYNFTEYITVKELEILNKFHFDYMDLIKQNKAIKYERN